MLLTSPKISVVPITQHLSLSKALKAINKNVRSSPRKVNLLLKFIKGKKVDVAIRDLSFARQRIAFDIKKTVLSLVLLAGISLGASSANAGCKAHLGDFDWDSANIHTAIASFMIKHGFDCDVEVTKGSTTPIMAAFFDGQIDVITELWEDNLVELLKPHFADGSIIHMGTNTPASEQAFWVDRATAEANGLKSVEDMKKPGVWELFKDPENPSKGRMTSCISGWTCYTINYVKLK